MKTQPTALFLRTALAAALAATLLLPAQADPVTPEDSPSRAHPSDSEPGTNSSQEGDSAETRNDVRHPARTHHRKKRSQKRRAKIYAKTQRTLHKHPRPALPHASTDAPPAAAKESVISTSYLSSAQESTIRKNLAARIPDLTKIDEVNKTPMPGLYEVRVGTDVVYTDAEGGFLIQGNLMDTRSRKNLTEERVNKLTAIDFNSLQFKNAFTIVRGNGKRKLAVFEDPNCGYCKRFEQDLQKVNNVTVHLFLIPILGEDSLTKSRQIWCSDDKAKTWMDWMVRDIAPKGNAICNTEALTANMDFARKYRINGTPTLVFTDGTRIPGAIDAQQVEQQLGK